MDRNVVIPIDAGDDIMLRLRPYKPIDAKTITGWIDNEYAFRQWCADRYDKFPISSDDMNSYYKQYDDNERLWAMTAFDYTDIVGHFIMRFPDNHSFDEIRLGFVIIDNKKRGKGYGKNMLNLAINYAFDIVKVNKVSLGVFENNTSALKCYESCGFKKIKLEKTESYCCMGEIWNCIEMVLVK